MPRSPRAAALDLPLPRPEEALPGRPTPLPLPSPEHAVLGRSMLPPYPAGAARALFGMGCFWGAERLFWRVPGVLVTAVGYAGGITPNPTYEEVCTGRTGHAEVVLVVFDPAATSYGDLLRVFWEGHDPTQGMRQGADRGTQYRSAVYAFDDAQLQAARASRDAYEAALRGEGARLGLGPITTEIARAGGFYFAEQHHQQYLAKNPGGYCGLGGTGVACPTGLGAVSPT